MKAYEWTATVTREGKLKFPQETALVLPRECPLRVIVLVPEPTDNNPLASEEMAWSTLTAEQFLAGYDEADSIYDEI